MRCSNQLKNVRIKIIIKAHVFIYKKVHHCAALIFVSEIPRKKIPEKISRNMVNNLLKYKNTPLIFNLFHPTDTNKYIKCIYPASNMVLF